VKRCVACGDGFADGGWRCPSCGFAPAVRDGVLSFTPEAADAGRGFDRESFDHLARIEDGSFWFRSRNRLIVWALETYFPRASSFLEVGCGTGYVLGGLRAARPALELAGAELYAEGLRFARERVPDAELLQLDATRMPFDAEWDAAGAFDVLEHVDDDRAVLAGLAQAVRPGGGILVTVPQHPTLWSAADDYAHHVRRYRRRELVGKARAAGLEIVRVTSFVSVLLPAMYVSRWRERHRGVEFDPEREHASAARVPGLERVLATERWAIRRGVSLPAGGSLLMVARRP
jgi:SAM-dependent methyltransferase